jgi:hypothetical protein
VATEGGEAVPSAANKRKKGDGDVTSGWLAIVMECGEWNCAADSGLT